MQYEYTTEFEDCQINLKNILFISNVDRRCDFLIAGQGKEKEVLYRLLFSMAYFAFLLGATLLCGFYPVY